MKLINNNIFLKISLTKFPFSLKNFATSFSKIYGKLNFYLCAVKKVLYFTLNSVFCRLMSYIVHFLTIFRIAFLYFFAQLIVGDLLTTLNFDYFLGLTVALKFSSTKILNFKVIKFGFIHI